MKNVLPALRFTLSILIATLAVAGVAYAGSLTPPSGTPAATSYTLEDIYQKLTTNTNATEANHTVSTTSSPTIATFHSLADLYNAAVDAKAALSSAAPLKTNQTTCWNVNGTPIADCSGIGVEQDGALKRGIARTYTDNTNGTITDGATSLMWKKCSEGLSGADCSTGTATQMTWSDALTYCAALSYAGHTTGWHLPNIRELLTMVDYGQAAPAIDTAKFPNTYSGSYWSATTGQYPGYKDYAWGVNFDDGFTPYGIKSGTFRVRCVRAS